MEKYIRLKEIGKGNYGKAILVRNIQDNDFYVMKTIEISNFTREQLDQALYEVNVIKTLKHPYIIRYIESFYDELNLCIIMEYADCGDLNKLVKSQRKIGLPLKEDIICNWFVQLSFAVKYLHDKNILHRDLKSSNIFICSNGNIKLGDFGIAKILKNTEDFAKTIVGTPYYLSPEICLRKPYNTKSDIWSLGCILYELMNLRHAFEGDNIGELILKILKGVYDPINKIYSLELQNILKEMLAINYSQRPDISKILEKRFLSHYIKLNLIRQITPVNYRKFAEFEFDKVKDLSSKNSKEKSKNSDIKSISKKNSDNSSNEKILIDNSSNNSKFKKISNLNLLKKSNNPSESNSRHTDSRSPSYHQSKSIEFKESKEVKDQINKFKRPYSNLKYHQKNREEHNKNVNKSINKEKSLIDENINSFFQKIIEKKQKKASGDLSKSEISKKDDEKSIFSKIEKLKSYLEKLLGLENFLALYFKISEIYSNKINASVNDLDFSKLTNLSETSKKQVVKLIKSLIKLENKQYC